MTMQHPEDTEALLERARREPARPRAAAPPPPPRSHPGYAVRSNRRAVRRRGSAFLVMAAFAGLGVAAVLYVSNALAVNRLADDVNTLRTRLQERTNAARLLQVEIDRLSTLDRVAAAAGRLGLAHPAAQPAVLPVPEDRVHGLER